MNKTSAAMPSRFAWLWTATCYCHSLIFTSRDPTGKACPFCGDAYAANQVRRHRYEARGGWARVVDGGSDVESAVGHMRSYGDDGKERRW